MNVTAPGAEAQLDNGEGPMLRDRESGKYKPERLYVLTLGCSRKSVRLAGLEVVVAHLGDSCTSAPSANSAASRASSCSAQSA